MGSGTLSLIDFDERVGEHLREVDVLFLGKGIQPRGDREIFPHGLVPVLFGVCVHVHTMALTNSPSAAWMDAGELAVGMAFPSSSSPSTQPDAASSAISTASASVAPSVTHPGRSGNSTV